MLNTYYSDFSYSHCCSWIIYDQWAYVIICVHLTLFHVLNFILIQSTCVSSLLRFIYSSPDFSKSLFSFLLLSTPPPEYQQLYWALTFTLKAWSKVKLLGNLISHLFCLWAFCNSGWAIVLNRGEGFPWWSSGSEFTYQCREHRFHPWSVKVPHASGQLIPCATTTEALCHCCSATIGATTMRSSAPRLDSSPCLPQLQKAHRLQQRPSGAKNK